jgi:hypothetical protein
VAVASVGGRAEEGGVQAGLTSITGSRSAWAPSPPRSAPSTGMMAMLADAICGLAEKIVRPLVSLLSFFAPGQTA